MIKLKKLYSTDDYFRSIEFKDGVNLILGDKSKNDDGKVTNEHMNGVGKSLAVELIDFCLMKRKNESKITRINDKYLPSKSFVYLHIECDAGDVVIGRNKNGDIKIKRGFEGTFKEYKFEDAKKSLKILTGLDDKPISLRDYLNFAIKNENYYYSDFNELYRSSYSELMKIHFYFFDIELSLLSRIQKAFDEYEAAKTRKREVNKWLDANELTIEELRTKRNKIEKSVEIIEDGMKYDQIVKSLDEKSEEIKQLESSLNELIEKKSTLRLELSEITAYIDEYQEDIYIEDDDVKIVFEKYRKGLGELVTKDLNELYKFRDQLTEFKSDLTKNKTEQLRQSISGLEDKIKVHNDKLDRYYSQITDSEKNNLVKSFRTYKEDVYDFRQYDEQLSRYESAQELVNDSKAGYANATHSLSRVVSKLKTTKDSFEKTFLELHKYVTGSSEASFNFQVDVDSAVSKRKDFFKFSVATETTGSAGSNQMRAALYDVALEINEATSAKTLKFMLHDNLIFGKIDKDSSIKFLNLVESKLGDDVQYIAAINSDDFNYEELIDKFDFNVSEKVVINLTKDKPLFHEIARGFLNN